MLERHPAVAEAAVARPARPRVGRGGRRDRRPQRRRDGRRSCAPHAAARWSAFKVPKDDRRCATTRCRGRRRASCCARDLLRSPRAAARHSATTHDERQRARSRGTEDQGGGHVRSNAPLPCQGWDVSATVLLRPQLALRVSRRHARRRRRPGTSSGRRSRSAPLLVADQADPVVAGRARRRGPRGCAECERRAAERGLPPIRLAGGLAAPRATRVNAARAALVADTEGRIKREVALALYEQLFVHGRRLDEPGGDRGRGRAGRRRRHPRKRSSPSDQAGAARPDRRRRSPAASSGSRRSSVDGDARSGATIGSRRPRRRERPRLPRREPRALGGRRRGLGGAPRALPAPPRSPSPSG